MLDENLPTFRFRNNPEKPLTTPLFFTQNGSDPSSEYIFRRADPSNPASRNRYAVALCNPLIYSVVYAEVQISPVWQPASLSAAELRALHGHPPPAAPLVPDSFTVLLYNPDQIVQVRMAAGGFTKSDSWEFEMPTQTFRKPSASALDRQAADPAKDDLGVPRLVFRWKKDGKLSKDMTCYMSGKSIGGRKSKEPDITVAMFKATAGSNGGSAVTVYEPNLQRVDMEDRKGLEVVILLVAEVVKDLWLVPRPDTFNVTGGPSTTVIGGRRKNLRPTGNPSSPVTMTGASSRPSQQGQNNGSNPAIDAETRRLRAMVEREERDRQRNEQAEQARLRRMLQEEENEALRRDEEVAMETERLRRLYGTEGQDLTSPSLPLPPRPQQQHLQPPQRPFSAGPSDSAPPGGRRRHGSGGAGSLALGLMQNPAASVSTFLGRVTGKSEDERKPRKKRSMHW